MSKSIDLQVSYSCDAKDCNEMIDHYFDRDVETKDIQEDFAESSWIHISHGQDTFHFCYHCAKKALLKLTGEEE